MLQTTELFQLVLALTFAPLLARSLRLTSIPGRHFVLSALVLLTLSYVFTVVEGYWLHDLFNTLEHAALAGCGVLFAVAAWVSKAHWYRRGGAR